MSKSISGLVGSLCEQQAALRMGPVVRYKSVDGVSLLREGIVIVGQRAVGENPTEAPAQTMAECHAGLNRSAGARWYVLVVSGEHGAKDEGQR